MSELNKDNPVQQSSASSGIGIRKKSTGEKIKDAFRSDDSRNIVDYLLFDVAIPALKKTVVDMFTNGINMLFYGGNYRPPQYGQYYPNGVNGRQPYYNYSNNYQSKTYNGQQSNQPYYQEELRVEDYKRLFWRSQEGAAAALDELRRDLAEYQIVTVDKVFDLWMRDADNSRGNPIRCPYTASYYGWTNLMESGIYEGRNDYGELVWYLNLPRHIRIR